MSTQTPILPPPIPIPALEQTVERYLERIRPLVATAEYEAAEQTARRFAAGSGSKLQSALQAYFDKSAPQSWLVRIWEHSYLSYREELSSNMNYLTTFDPAKVPHRGSLAEYMAALVHAFTRVYVQHADGTLPVESGRSGPLSMDQFDVVFGACRIPGSGICELFIGEKTSKNAHIAVLCRENIYTLQVTDQDGKTLSVASITDGIARIMASNDASAPNIGTMTAAKRDHAALLYKHINGLDARNAANFGLINSAIFALCIDERGERSQDVATFEQLYGYGKNRWFEKCFQLIVGDDYSIGFNNEHTAYDAAVWISIITGVYADITGGCDGSGSGVAAAIQRLDWVTDQHALDALAKMEAADIARGKTIPLRTFDFSDFGSGGMKELKCSPDAFFHLALQLAWYRLRGRIDSTYEAVSMRQYHQGRTECMRPSTTLVLDFITALNEGRPREELVSMARAAFDRHVEMIVQCQQGGGPERHLTALQTMASQQGMVLSPEEDIFASAAYKQLKHDTISSSGLFTKGLGLFAFGPVVEDGFGVGYVIDAGSIRLCISCMEQSRDLLEP
ncbi:MAG: choline/carnitine O-acyltransferase, partial [Defluviitaleaceae bacterium]|nr:choline/carnitine O-acyltransferase [Defluviitaleaceae bacterium]